MTSGALLGNARALGRLGGQGARAIGLADQDAAPVVVVQDLSRSLVGEVIEARANAGVTLVVQSAADTSPWPFFYFHALSPGGVVVEDFIYIGTGGVATPPTPYSENGAGLWKIPAEVGGYTNVVGHYATNSTPPPYTSAIDSNAIRAAQKIEVGGEPTEANLWVEDPDYAWPFWGTPGESFETADYKLARLGLDQDNSQPDVAIPGSFRLQPGMRWYFGPGEGLLVFPQLLTVGSPGNEPTCQVGLTWREVPEGQALP